MIKVVKQVVYEFVENGRVQESKELASLVITVPPTHIAEFKELVHRATNLWPDSSAAIKIFADMITNDGKVLQDYEDRYKVMKGK